MNTGNDLVKEYYNAIRPYQDRINYLSLLSTPYCIVDLAKDKGECEIEIKHKLSASAEEEINFLKECIRQIEEKIFKKEWNAIHNRHML